MAKKKTGTTTPAPAPTTKPSDTSDTSTSLAKLMVDGYDVELNLPRLWRHNMSGVLIGYLNGPSEIPGHLRFYGRRVHSWASEHRLDCSQLAIKGCKKGDSLGETLMMHIAIEGSVELLPMNKDVLAASMALPADGNH